MLPAPSFSMPEIGPDIRLRVERGADVPAREALLDAAMGKARRRKSSEAIRRGRMPADGLSLIAEDEAGRVVGTVRLWHVDAGGRRALLLGPLAVQPGLDGRGIGSMLMRRAIAEASFRGHAAILLVGDAAYYERFGFSAQATGRLAMPGPYERHRLLALELAPGALEGADGVIRGSGRRLVADRRAA
ncbi:GNAT family N-acetyltransferase [Aureimonas altamirensis]|uniref:GNAT family N-acetyltransferase n=1 Tax=Aureimonas altamirensis TaxID=370622 RepID=UPI003D81AEC8